MFSSSDSASTSSKKTKYEPDYSRVPNTLIAMPEHILYQILSYLDFNQKKEFSLVCKKFNGVFSWPRNLRSIWFRVEKGKRIAEINRPYAMLEMDCKQANGFKSFPGNVWKVVGDSLQGIRIKNEETLMAREFIDLLPRFQNLTQLDIVLSNDFIEEKMIKSKFKVKSLVKMEHLEQLRINTELFCYLEGRLVEFTSTKLQSFEIVSMEYFWSSEIEKFIDFNKIRAIIGKQINLKALQIKGGYRLNLFDSPLTMQSQLESFNVNGHRMTDLQQDNFCDFINAQHALKLLEFTTNFKKTDKMTRFLEGRFDLPMSKVTVRIQYRYFLDTYTLEQLKTAAAGPPNFTVTELSYHEYGQSQPSYASLKVSDKLPLLVSKFPNLTSIEIYGNDWVLDSIEPLKQLEKLTKLNLSTSDTCTTILKDVTIPSLESFTFTACYVNDFNSPDLLDFIARHPAINKLRFETTYSQSKSNNVINNILSHSLLNLPKLMHFSTYVEPFEPDKAVRVIRDHANLGFVLESMRFNHILSKVIMKRYDGQIVFRNCNSTKWQHTEEAE